MEASAHQKSTTSENDERLSHEDAMQLFDWQDAYSSERNRDRQLHFATADNRVCVLWNEQLRTGMRRHVFKESVDVGKGLVAFSIPE